MIRIQNIVKSFKNQQVINDVSMELQTSKINMFIGRSGSGKTVLMKIILGLFQPNSGNIIYENQNLWSLNKHEKKMLYSQLGMVFQNAALFDSMSVEENILIPLTIYTKKTSKEKLSRVNEVLEQVNMEGQNKKHPNELSGGMKKRVAIARAIALKPKYLFCDEPNSGLDPHTSIVIDNLIHQLTISNNITTLINTHDMNSVLEIGDQIFFLNEGKLAWQGDSKQILQAKDPLIVDFVFPSKFHKIIKTQLTLK